MGSFVRFYSKRAGPQGNYEDAAFRSLLTAEYCMSGLPSQCFFYTAQAKGADFNRGVSSLHTKKKKKHCGTYPMPGWATNPTLNEVTIGVGSYSQGQTPAQLAKLQNYPQVKVMAIYHIRHIHIT